MTSEKTDKRRRYSATVKAQVVAECDKPGASVAKVAMAHGINANVVHRWRQLAREGKFQAPATTGEFIALPLAMPAASAVTTADIPVCQPAGQPHEGVGARWHWRVAGG